MTHLNKKVLSALILSAGLLFSGRSQAQECTKDCGDEANFSITGYVDAYYAYYTDSVGPGKYQQFPTTSPRSNSPSLNIAQLAVQYDGELIRAKGAFQFGDLPGAVWSNPYNNIQEAYVGVKIYSKLWIDAGFFATHFGTESALPISNIASSVAVGTFYEPYFESGVRAVFTPCEHFTVKAYLLNGYNKFIDNNEKKSFGMLATYAFDGEGRDVNYSNYIGDDSQPGTTVKHLRIHQNAYLNYRFDRFKIQVGGDYCMQQNSDFATGAGTKTAAMYSALATAKYQVTKSYGVYGRGEMFSDPEGYMSTVIMDHAGKLTGYKLFGFTAGAEFKPSAQSYVRLEGRALQMDKDQYIFYHDGKLYNSRFEVMVNAGISFDLLRAKLGKKIVKIERKEIETEPDTKDGDSK